MRRTSLVFAAIALTASAAYSGDGTVRRSAQPIPGRYIVVLASGADIATAVNVARNLTGARVGQIYDRGLKGFAVEISDADAQALALDPLVEFVEEDATVAVTASPWGLDRIDQRALPLDGTYINDVAGAGVTVYVVDTGISAHNEFGSRVVGGFSAFGDSNPADCNGHGTHVAGVVGGSTFGVAKAATLVPVRVLDCNGSGSLSTVLAGLDWILKDQEQAPRQAVVNMSLAGSASSVLDNQVKRLIAAGLTTVVAAGNRNSDACTTSPARVAAALTVGAATETDQRATFSNYGTCLDLFAPGVNIVSSWYASPSATAFSSGTSSAAPFVSGVAALWLQMYPGTSPDTVGQSLLSQATRDVLTAVGSGSPNRLLFSGVSSLDGSSAQVLSDPSFEEGTTYWSSDVCSSTNPAGCNNNMEATSFPSRSGNKHQAIGGAPRTFHVVSEAVSVPSRLSRAELGLYLWVVTKNQSLAAVDVLRVEIRDAAGGLLETVGTFSNLDASETYAQRRFDVSRYRGQKIRISFTGIQSQDPPTWFLLDDVTLKIWP